MFIENKDQLKKMLSSFEYSHYPDGDSGVSPREGGATNYWLTCSMGSVEFESTLSLEELNAAYDEWAAE